MSTPAQVTKEHLALANDTGMEPEVAERFAQRIADSEARAVEKLHAEANNSEAKTTMEPSNAPTLQWTHELHEDYYVLNRGDVQVGILFPDTGMPVGYIRHFVATLNAYYPTEPGTRFPCGSTDTARAERAEADADSTRERALTLANSLDEAQAELAAEREKVRVLRDAMKFIANDDNYMEPYFDPCQLASSALAATEETK